MSTGLFDDIPQKDQNRAAPEAKKTAPMGLKLFDDIPANSGQSNLTDAEKKAAQEYRARVARELSRGSVALGSGFIEGQIGVPASSLIPSSFMDAKKLEEIEDEYPVARGTGQIGSMFTGINAIINRAASLPFKGASRLMGLEKLRKAESPVVRFAGSQAENVGDFATSLPLSAVLQQGKSELANTVVGNQGIDPAGSLSRVLEAGKIGVEATQDPVLAGLAVGVPAAMRASGLGREMYLRGVPPSQQQIKAGKGMVADQQMDLGLLGGREAIRSRAKKLTVASEEMRNRVIDEADKVLARKYIPKPGRGGEYVTSFEPKINPRRSPEAPPPPPTSSTDVSIQQSGVPSPDRIVSRGPILNDETIEGLSPDAVEKVIEMTMTGKGFRPNFIDKPHIITGAELAKKLKPEWKKLKNTLGAESQASDLGKFIIRVSQRGPMNFRDLHEERKRLLEFIRRRSGPTGAANAFASGDQRLVAPALAELTLQQRGLISAIDQTLEEGFKKTVRRNDFYRKYRQAGKDEQSAYGARQSMQTKENLEAQSYQNGRLAETMALRYGLPTVLGSMAASSQGFTPMQSLAAGIGTGLAVKPLTSQAALTRGASLLTGRDATSGLAKALGPANIQDLAKFELYRRLLQEQAPPEENE